MIRRFFLPALLFFTFSVTYADGLQVIPLHHQSAEDIIPIIRPLIGNNDVVTGSGYKLIVRAPAHRVEEIKELLLEIDRPLQQLMISVRQDRQLSRQTNRQSVAGNVGGDNGRLKFGRPAPRSEGLTMQYQDGDDILQAHINQRDTSINDDISQQVRTISGRPAYIAVGHSRPIPLQQTVVQGNQLIRTQYTQYQDTNSGFYVTPRLRGEQVMLEITTRRQQPGRRHIESSQLSTTVSGRLDEWISLGGSNEISNQSASTLSREKATQSSDLRNISVKVTLAP